MQSGKLSIDPAFVVAPVNRRVFGSFVEHMGRCVYGGIFEPGHATSDDDGLRGDVLELVRELGVTAVRYPGGNFVSGYRWEDGVGPVADRPTRLDPAWRTIETNAFGLNEFMAWARKAEVEPIMATNLGTRGLPEAMELLEYANHPQGTALSDLRIEHGAKEPHGIRLWCLGNEMDGPWQLGHMTAAEYGRVAAETARGMRQLDPDLELVACGSSGRAMATFGEWEATVLEHTYELVDYISAHAYYELEGDDVAGFLASSVDMDRFIRDVVATADHVGAKLASTKKIDISFDEWNVWYQRDLAGAVGQQDWTVAPRLSEDAYTVLDAVVVGSLLITLLQHSDRVTIACQAQLVNTIAPIRSEPDGPAWRQSIFHPFALMARHARGQVLDLRVDAPTLTTAKHGEVAVLDAVATHDAETGQLAVFVVNRNPTEAVSFATDLRGFGAASLTEAVVLADDDLFAANTMQEPDRVVPRPHTSAAVDGTTLRAELPPASWSMFRLQLS
ncbi:arabinosylfuranosidase ArfA [Cellulomonas dongxiuzhuiae]|uniref:non-reducing end alpha-L-arabinofuranosidase n=1 Tax=Cellulomonas dongxiuzhuiae TaxID=2819979 RepID=A0ABX8GJ77_9CELL|nr:alpha-N-arabinofuranosidase [Cellulomonas dongxiuzhuiae]MBO3087966.1 alpha-N-arabinofuranosidase [Cellulomonas dongxiuzhuiae]MBO3094682.1 alpha-N-arabinofuranosidase [Cellulomonas dongxiuzhuiae]QWC15686.1 alpha-N-arabinofuranosidase [Cellulomonas dongxiuzhuiae]